jgi:peptidoglycan/LPS O-acetylase OafA/YrhL
VEFEPAYRRDVDGLRGFAVAAVVCFHLFPMWFPGGFIGVDVFFVLSGFLITGIIIRDVKAERFTFAGFYARRVRRLFPALFTVLVACAALGWVSLSADEYRQLGMHTAAGAGFLSNFALWREAGYFDIAAELKPLLHLWSLGIEEQFYLVWPPLLLLAWKWRAQRSTIAAVALVSLGFCLWRTPQDPVSSFYLPATRAWELGAGGFVAAAGSLPWVRRLPPGLVVLLEAALLLGSVFLLDDRQAFPGWRAMAPVLGTVLVLANEDGWANREFLSHPLGVWLGKISYPLYLWHWPLLSFTRIAEAVTVGLPTRIVILGASVLLAWMTWRWIEMPIRYGANGGRKAAAACLLMAAAGVAGGAVYAQQGFAERPVAKLMAQIDRARKDWDYPAPPKAPRSLALPGSTGETVLFWGDSHMEQYWPKVKALQDSGAVMANAIFITGSGCPPFKESHGRSPGCDGVYEAALSKAREPRTRTVVISAYWEKYAAGNADELVKDFSATLRDLSGKRVVVVLSNPVDRAYYPDNIAGARWRTIFRHQPPWENTAPLDREEKQRETAGLRDALRAAAARAGAAVVDPFDYLCDRVFCPVVVDAQPVFSDNHHLRPFFARSRAGFIDPLLVEPSPAAVPRAAGPLSQGS